MLLYGDSHGTGRRCDGESPPPDASMELRRIKALLGGSPIPIIVTAALSQSSLARRTIGVASGRCRSFLLSLSPSGANLCGYINKTAGKRIKKKKVNRETKSNQHVTGGGLTGLPSIPLDSRPSTSVPHIAVVNPNVQFFVD